MRRDGPWVHWEIVAERGCAILFHAPAAEPLHTGTSGRLFTEQFPDREYSRELMAAVIAPEEIGFYDFRTDLLRAKYVESFCPELSLVTESGGPMRFKIRGDLLPDGPWRLELVLNGR